MITPSTLLTDAAIFRNRVWNDFENGAQNDISWLHEMWSTRGHKAVSALWERLRPIIDEAEVKTLRYVPFRPTDSTPSPFLEHRTGN